MDEKPPQEVGSVAEEAARFLAALGRARMSRDADAGNSPRTTMAAAESAWRPAGKVHLKSAALSMWRASEEATATTPPAEAWTSATDGVDRTEVADNAVREGEPWA